jgi:hypothetical protein
MLKTVSSVANAIGALNYKGTWNASTNDPTLTSGVGVKGDYYVVSVAGNTDLDGTTLWGVGDWAVFNGSVWQKVDGGSTGDFTSVITNTLTVNSSAALNLATTASATFATSSLPLVPEGYLTITISGVTKKIPYYAA